jgi:pseudaminic acid cytidylyltransferase
MANLAIIPARGGSKRIPRKNIKEFLGKPIIAYSIEAAIKSRLFDEVVVSTDDEEIAQIALNYGAKVPFMRSKLNSSDVATTYEVIEEVLLQYKQMGEDFDLVCCLYPCAPFITEFILNDAFWKLSNQMYDSVFPIIKYSSPIQRAIRIEDNKARFINPEFSTYRTQDFEKKYFDAGQFYFFRPKKILEEKTIVVENSGFIVLEKNVVEDIDVLEDWEAAEIKYRIIHNL